MVEYTDFVEFIEGAGRVSQAHEAQAGSDGLHANSRGANGRKGSIIVRDGISHDGVDVTHKWNSKDHVADPGGRLAKGSIRSLDKANAVLCVVVLGWFCSEVEWMKREFGPIIKSDSKVEWSLTRNIICNNKYINIYISATVPRENWGGIL